VFSPEDQLDVRTKLSLRAEQSGSHLEYYLSSDGASCWSIRVSLSLTACKPLPVPFSNLAPFLRNVREAVYGGLANKVSRGNETRFENFVPSGEQLHLSCLDHWAQVFQSHFDTTHSAAVEWLHSPKPLRTRFHVTDVVG